MASKGLLCDECDRRHKQWEKVGETTFANGMHEGVRERLECEHCGSVVRQVRA